MERLRRVASLWSWLPAFRAVAETQHLPSASGHLDVSASALSRTIRLLEEDVGQPLFVRQGRRIELNEPGERFLTAVRTAMRLVHEGILSAGERELEGPVHISSANLVTDAVMLPTLAQLRISHSSLLPHLRRSEHSEIESRLLRGQLDVALTTTPVVHPQVEKVALGRLTSGVYCNVEHPLTAATELPMQALTDHPFAVWGQLSDGTCADGWPTDVERRIGAVVHNPSLALDLAATTPLLVIVPDALIQHGLRGDRLRRLPVALGLSTPVFAHYRTALGLTGQSRAETVLEIARSAIAGGLKRE